MTRGRDRKVVVLMAEDDHGDRVLAGKALEGARLVTEVHTVDDGQRLMDYLHRRDEFSDPAISPRPDLILLDLNMPKKNGRVALEEIRSDGELCGIPVVVLSTSWAKSDIEESYRLGANSFITKPTTFDGLVEAVRLLESYWFDLVSIPQS